MHACDIKFVGINVCGTCLISENRKHLYPKNIHAIRYMYEKSLYTCMHIFYTELGG